MMLDIASVGQREERARTIEHRVKERVGRTVRAFVGEDWNIMIWSKDTEALDAVIELIGEEFHQEPTYPQQPIKGGGGWKGHKTAMIFFNKQQCK